MNTNKKIKHWLVYPKSNNLEREAFKAISLESPTSGYITGFEEDGNEYSCLLDYWSFTPVYEEENVFTKDMLISGEHIIELVNGTRYLVAGDYLISETGYMSLDKYGSDLLNNIKSNTEFHIVKVFSGKTYNGYSKEIFAGNGFSKYLHTNSLELVWKRETSEQAQKRVEREEKLKEIQSLKEEVKRAQKALEAAEEELENWQVIQENIYESLRS